MNWEAYIGKTVSVLILGKDNKQENYLGSIESVTDGFMAINPNNDAFTIEKIIFQTALIQSIWIYK